MLVQNSAQKTWDSTWWRGERAVAESWRPFGGRREAIVANQCCIRQGLSRDLQILWISFAIRLGQRMHSTIERRGRAAPAAPVEIA